MAESLADRIGGSIEVPSLSSDDRSSSKNVKIRFTIFGAIFRAQVGPSRLQPSRLTVSGREQMIFTDLAADDLSGFLEGFKTAESGCDARYVKGLECYRAGQLSCGRWRSCRVPGASPDRASFEDLRRYQLHFVASGAGATAPGWSFGSSGARACPCEGMQRQGAARIDTRVQQSCHTRQNPPAAALKSPLVSAAPPSPFPPAGFLR